MTMSRRAMVLLVPLVALCSVSETSGEVVRFEIAERAPYADGWSFGEIGSYERVLGTVHYEVDPLSAPNRPIVDLELAPRNRRGFVEFSADFEILMPVDPAKSNGTLLYDVNNRGNRVCLGQFNGGADEFLMRRGFVVAWCGWIAEVLPGDERLILDAPVATNPDGTPIVGLVRAEMAPDQAAERLNIAHWANMGSYRPTERGLAEATLTWRLREKDARQPIPCKRWRIEQTDMDVNGRRGAQPLIELSLDGGFQAGHLYELIYEAEGPIVQGVGFAAIRDFVSFLRHDASEANPLASGGRSAVERTIGFGVSQSGRCLRMFVHDGFNGDERGRQVFDGLMPHVAGAGLGFFNHRFASPTRHNGQHDNHAYPADVFPFTYGDERHPVTGEIDGILHKAKAAGVSPKVMHTQTSAEYWTRSGSLVHTDPAGRRDSSIPNDVRIYAIGGAQHGPGNGVPGEASSSQLPANPTDYRPLMRALLVAMDDWLREDASPQPSVYPRIADGSLGGWREQESGWNALPNVRYPGVIQQPEWRDYGPEFATRRIVSRQPPATLSEPYRVLVPAYGSDNNERGMLLLPSIAAPVATFTGWNLRSPSLGAEEELVSLIGAYIPFAATANEREGAHDPRPAIAERYASFDDYRQQFEAAADRLVAERYLLDEDRPQLLELMARHAPLFEASSAASN